MKKILKLLVIVSLIGIVNYAGFFLDNGIGLKGMQLGGAYTADPMSGEALYWNVANLVNVKDSEFYVSYAQKFSDLTNYSFIYNTKLSADSALGVAYYRVGVDNNDVRDSSGSKTGSFQYVNEAYFIGYSKALSDSSSCGLTVKSVSQKAVDQASYISLDLAYRMQLLKNLSLGLVAQDIYNNGNPADIKPIYRAGLSTQLFDCVFSADYMYHSLFSTGYYKFGVGYVGLPFVEIKAGYSDYDKNFYAGLSTSFFGIKIDYLYTNPELDVVHQFGLGIDF
ncbi:MAG: hypothetical protein PHV30_08810 [Candidatus Margulisbacteria bacterium]|nr:hypothetical protein [Candidatus Margulisiibacteriota bacterium]